MRWGRDKEGERQTGRKMRKEGRERERESEREREKERGDR